VCCALDLLPIRSSFGFLSSVSSSTILATPVVLDRYEANTPIHLGRRSARGFGIRPATAGRVVRRLDDGPPHAMATLEPPLTKLAPVISRNAEWAVL
jgi:hypothetical protein